MESCSSVAAVILLWFILGMVLVGEPVGRERSSVGLPVIPFCALYGIRANGTACNVEFPEFSTTNSAPWIIGCDLRDALGIDPIDVLLRGFCCLGSYPNVSVVFFAMRCADDEVAAVTDPENPPLDVTRFFARLVLDVKFPVVPAGEPLAGDVGDPCWARLRIGITSGGMPFFAAKRPKFVIDPSFDWRSLDADRLRLPIGVLSGIMVVGFVFTKLAVVPEENDALLRTIWPIAPVGILDPYNSRSLGVSSFNASKSPPDLHRERNPLGSCSGSISSSTNCGSLIKFRHRTMARTVSMALRNFNSAL